MTVFTADNTWTQGLNATVFINGQRVNFILEADTEQGIATGFVKDDDGNFIMSAPGSDELATVTYWGRVMVILTPIRTQVVYQDSTSN